MIVLVAVAERQVPINDQFNVEPLATTGPAGIFNRAARPTETKLDVEVVGVYTTLELAALARGVHAASHPGRRYVQKVAQLDDAAPEPPAPVGCIKCGTQTGGPSFCGPCQQKHWQESRDLDPLAGGPDPDTVKALT